jgi:hypothetical protein
MATAKSTATKSKSSLETVKRLLAAGQTTTTEVVSGRHQSMYAKCPQDGQPSSVRRVSREGGNAIFEVTMRCTSCATDFVAKAESLYLQ